MAQLRPSSEIASEIKRIRRNHFRTQGRFAEALKTSQSRVSAWEGADDDYRFDLETLRKVAEVGEVPLAVFFEGSIDPEQPLSANDVAEVRDRVRRMVAIGEEVLGMLDGALVGDLGEFRPRPGEEETKRRA